MFVLGCHRSGTSLLAGIISDVLSKKQTLTETSKQLSPQVDNPGGFFESRQLVEFNESLLEELGINWQIPPLHPVNWQCASVLPKLISARTTFSKQALSYHWVDKDPRLCLTYPAFQHILLKRTPIAAIIRHPYEVAGSLQTRDIIPLAKGLVIWFLYNQHISREITPEDYLTSYESLITREENSIRSLAKYISKVVPNLDNTTKSLSEALENRVQPDWRRNKSTKPTNILPEMEWIDVAKACLDRFEAIKASNFNIDDYRASFADTPDAILRSCAVLGWQNIQRRSNEHSNELALVQAELKNLKESNSWKSTKYLRWLADLLKKYK